MTRRAGKRKARNELARKMADPPKPPEPPPLVPPDNLPEAVSRSMEMRALSQGWLMDSPKAAELRQGLMQKVMSIAVKTTDEKLAIQAFRALTTAELRQQAVRLAAFNRELPDQQHVTNVQVNIGGDRRPNNEVVQELLKRADVRSAVTGQVIDGEVA